MFARLLIVVAVAALAVPQEPIMSDTSQGQSDKEQIAAHIRGLFDAFIRKDRAAIRAGHTEDWKGFQIKSTRLVRGIDDYMAAADQVLGSLRAVRYEFLDMDIEIHGDVAIVFYAARDWIIGDDGKEKTVLLRSVDIYRRENGGWNQCGSHICAMPDTEAQGARPAVSENAGAGIR